MAENVARVGPDKAKIEADGHGCNGCTHTCTGPAVSGSVTVIVNGKPVVRESDNGIHAACCGPNTWVTKTYSATVKANGLGVHRKNDMTTHCGGTGKMTAGSDNVIAGG